MDEFVKRIWNYLQSEWHVIRRAPLALSLISAIVGGGVWWITSTYYVSYYKGTVRNLTTERDAAKGQKELAEAELAKVQRELARGQTRPSVENTDPSSHFKIRLDNIYFATIAGRNRLALVASVQNLGVPSPATDWKLTVKVGKHEYTGQPYTPIESYLWSLTPGKCFYFRKESSLIQKTTAPIPSNDIEQGVLMYEFPNIPQEELKREHAVFQLECEDFDRNTSQGSLLLSDTKNSPELPTDLITEPSTCLNIH